MTPISLECNSIHNPLGIDTASYRLSWKIDTAEKTQQAYQIMAASSKKRLDAEKPDLWDSGKTVSSQSRDIQYKGRALESAKRIYWKVRLWNNARKPHPWSETAFWETGLLSHADWEPAQWIGPAYPDNKKITPPGKWIGFIGSNRMSVFEKRFTCRREAITECRITACFGESGEIRINDKHVGNITTWKTGFKQIPVRPDMLQPGENTIRITVNDRKKIAIFNFGLRISHADQSDQQILSDESWRFTPIVSENESEPETPAGRAALLDHEMDGIRLPLLPDWPSAILRREFIAPDTATDARLYICGLGCYEAFINGRRVGDRVFNPAITDYDKRVLYDVYDVTELLASGANALGVHLGNGWYGNNSGIIRWTAYGPPVLLARLVIRSGDRVVTVCSDSDWKFTQGPAVYNNVFIGEQYDARLEIPGWNKAGFDDSAWKTCTAAEPPGGRPVWQHIDPIRRITTLNPLCRTASRSGAHIYDMGKNISGRPTITVNEPAGTAVTLTFSEALDSDGELDPASTLGGQKLRPPQHDIYVSAGRGEETWEPSFTYHGFRYIQVNGSTRDPLNIRAVVVHNDIRSAGTFDSSDPLLNRIHETAIHTARCNFHGIPTDCPHRERAGWSGDAHAYCETAIYNLNIRTFFEKYLADMETSMGREGVPGIPTNVFPGKRTSGLIHPDWGHIIAALPWAMYLFYGDRHLLQRYYPHMVTWFDYLDNRYPDGHATEGFGDWAPPGGNDCQPFAPALSSTAYYYSGVGLALQTAEILGYTKDASRWQHLRKKINDRFVREYFMDRKKTFGSQAADCLALAFGLAPDGTEKQIAEGMVQRIKENDFRIACGILSLKHLFQVLSDYGHTDTALSMLRRKGMPGFHAMIEQGETTLWEALPEKENSCVSAGSHSHPFQGGFASWFHSHLAGIHPDSQAPGFQTIRLRPFFTSKLDHVRGEHESPYGTITSEWKRTENDRFIWNISTPAGTKGIIGLPQDMRSRVEIIPVGNIIE